MSLIDLNEYRTSTKNENKVYIYKELNLFKREAQGWTRADTEAKITTRRK